MLDLYLKNVKTLKGHPIASRLLEANMLSIIKKTTQVAKTNASWQHNS
jgi:hypothetical protein